MMTEQKHHEEREESSSIDPDISCEEAAIVHDADDLAGSMTDDGEIIGEIETENEVSSPVTIDSALKSDVVEDLNKSVVEVQNESDAPVDSSDVSLGNDTRMEENAIVHDSNRTNSDEYNAEDAGAVSSTKPTHDDESFSLENNNNVSSDAASVETATSTNQIPVKELQEKRTKTLVMKESQISSPKHKTPSKSNQNELIRSDGKRQLLTPTPKKPTQLIKIEGKRDLLSESVEYNTINLQSRKEQSSLFLEAATPQKSSALNARRAAWTPNSKERNVDLLAKFIEYKDQIPPTPMARPKGSNDSRRRPPSTSTGRQSWPMIEPRSRPSTSPMPKSTRQLGVEKRRSLPDASILSSYKSYDPVDYDIPTSSIKRRSVMSPMTPESQRGSRKSVGLNKRHSIREISEEKPDSGRIKLKRMAFNVLSTSVKIFCATSIVARSLTFIGADRSLLYYMLETPAIWFVRIYILLFHVILILIEMQVSLPGIIPKGTLNNFVHRAFIQSFIGLLDISMNANRSLVEYDGSENEVDAWVDLAFIVLRVSPRGLLFCAFLYFILAVCGNDGQSIIAVNRRSNGVPIDFDA